MTGIGILLIVLGLGSLLLPLFDLQFRLMEFVDPYQPFAGIIVGAIGAVLVGVSYQQRRAKAASASASASASPAGASSSASPADVSGDQP